MLNRIAAIDTANLGPVLVHQANPRADMGADQVLMGLAGKLFVQLSPAKSK